MYEVQAIWLHNNDGVRKGGEQGGGGAGFRWMITRREELAGP